jgi:hypothetical protein
MLYSRVSRCFCVRNRLEAFAGCWSTPGAPRHPPQRGIRGAHNAKPGRGIPGALNAMPGRGIGGALNAMDFKCFVLLSYTRAYQKPLE